jgi:hypothetical protein
MDFIWESLTLSHTDDGQLLLVLMLTFFFLKKRYRPVIRKNSWTVRSNRMWHDLLMEIYSAWRTGTFHFSKPFIVKKVSKIYTIVKREVRRNVPNLIKVNPAYGDVIIKIKFFKRWVFLSLADCSLRNREIRFENYKLIIFWKWYLNWYLVCGSL